MAHEPEREGQEGPGKDSGQELDTLDAIKAIVAYNARAAITDETQLTLFLQSWWSRTYNRPLKDPLLLSYTLEELLYEFYDRIERRKAEEERINSEADKIEEDKDKAVLDWAEQEEKRELEALKSQASAEESKTPIDPTKEIANVAWMEEQLKEAKQLHGEDFGEDIEMSFEDD
jgi:hypothetical protein